MDVGTELRKGDELIAWQDVEGGFPQPSDHSAPPERVEGLPQSLPVPVLVEDVGKDGVPDVLVGSTVLTFCDLFVGARLLVYSVDDRGNERRVGGGVATAGCNWTAVEAVKKELKYCARQSLCALESPRDSQCVFAHGSIDVPSIRAPLCPGDIPDRSLDGGHNMYACLEPTAATGDFPVTVDLEYDYQCVEEQRSPRRRGRGAPWEAAPQGAHVARDRW